MSRAIKNKKESLHDFIIKTLLGFTPKIIEESSEKFYFCEDSFVDYNKKEILIKICREEINWIKEGFPSFISASNIEIEDLVEGLRLQGKFVDAYGSLLSGDELLLNNYDISYREENKNEKGFCNILSFATINSSGLARFSQIVYSFLYNKILLREDLKFNIPFKPNLLEEFGGKRAVYRYGNTLSLKTNLEVYKKVDKKHWQSDSFKDTLSYPRLILRNPSLINYKNGDPDRTLFKESLDRGCIALTKSKGWKTKK